ncbi:MAG TPA: membrane protein insertase YidC [Caulobacteraceae bacterium]|nr:membrane protein insertase YidC [Caulobacteraceae bacterium]
MPNDNNKNMILFIAISAILVLGYQFFVISPAEKRAQIARAQAEATAPATAAATGPVQSQLSRAQALALGPRVTIDTPSLIGSIALKGARVDDLSLKGYRDTIEKTSPLVELLRPEGMADAYFAELGWAGVNLPGLPAPDTVWTLASGDVLSPGHPVVLTYASPSGLTFTRRIEIDAKFMFTFTDTVANTGPAPVTLLPYVSVQRQGLPGGLNKNNIVHEGAIGVLGLDKPDLQLASYKDWKKKGEIDWQSRGGWLGITDKYWMTAFVPIQSERIDAKARVTTDRATGIDIYETTYTAGARAVASGAQVSEVSHLFAGAKTVPLLKDYQKTIGAPRFDDAVDWGHLWFLTKPIFWLLEQFYQRVGNFGVAILMLTVVIRALTFPLANKGFEMGVKMKKLQPQLKELQARLKEDPAAQQKEMMALYAKEKVNPVTGCLPIFLQIPVFYSLTKLFTVTIEMRHAPFFGWIHDLSARDPTTIMNLFGLIPWDPSSAPLIGAFLGGMLHVGVWPLLYGFSMWLSQSMTPQTGIDPTQQMMFKVMPFLFTFILAQYSVGLLIYWTWSSLITILQQYLMMRRFKVDNPIDDFIGRFAAKPQPPG